MLNKTYKLVTVFMVMLLVLGLALVACKAPAETVTPPAPPQTEQPATPPATPPAATTPAAHEVTYKAKTYTNSQYGFSIQYPDDWGEYNAIVKGNCVAAFANSVGLPGFSLIVEDANAPVTADWLVAATNALDSTSGAKVTDLKETTLFDGTPAVQYVVNYNYTTYPIKAFGVSADKNGKRIRVVVWTIDSMVAYDEAASSEIAHALSVK
jgi:hypothetical protein